MRLLTLETKHFRQHRDKTFHFAEGVNLVRGANEAGKSTALEALGYNLFGASMLMDPMERVITKGETNGMKTRLTFEAQGTVFVCDRSQTGAEIRVEGETKPLATGQKEVTLKVESLLGIPHGKADLTMFANQNEVRGVLSVGPAATAQFIESLGNFGEIDNLLTKLSLKLKTGPTRHIEEKVAQLEEQIKEAPKLKSPALMAQLEQAVQVAEQMAQNSQAELQAAEQSLASITSKNRETELTRQHLEKELTSLLSQKSEHERKISTWKVSIAAATALPEKVSEMEALTKQAYEYGVYAGMPLAPEVVWEGNWASLDAEGARVIEELAAVSSSVAGARATVTQKLSQKILTTVCPTCKQNVGDLAIAATANAEIDLEVAKLQTAITSDTARAADLRSETSDLQAVAIAGNKVEAWLKNYGHLVDADLNFVPAKLTWKGLVPAAVQMPDQVELDRLKTAVAAGKQAAVNLSALGEFDASRLETIQIGLAGLGLVDDSAEVSKVTSLRSQVQESQTALEGLRKTLIDTKVANDQNRWQLDRLLDDSNAAMKELKQVQADNAILKEAKEARKAVMDMIWNKTMGAISGYFSQLRGVPSIVSREEDSFVVDGSKSRLSGSTIDILGLALRISVCKIFSSCGILILDEPSSGCDAMRTAQMISVLSASGFDQIIVVTHKDQDESSGANLIQL